MARLHRHELNFERSIAFVRDNLDNVNTLSNEILNSVNFIAGTFFTLLPPGSDLDRLYEFKEGVILPQNPIIESIINEKKSRHSVTPTIEEALSEFIFYKINDNKNLSCVFDDVLHDPQSPHLKLFYEKKGLYLFGNEVFYIIRQYNNNLEFILRCIGKSFAHWHSLGVLAEADCFNNINDNVLTLENIQNICKNTNTIMVSAYDGEGYVFWEKSPA